MKKKAWIAVLLLLACTTVLAVVHLSGREKTEPLNLQVRSGEKTVTVNVAALKSVTVEGTTVNGKGEEKQIHEEGVSLKAVLEAAGLGGCETVKVCAADEYSAEVSVDEVSEDGKVWLLKQEDTLRLLVFGDKNSKRDVKNVERLELK